jgi:capsular exopolysaccharide synthesis family protein
VTDVPTLAVVPVEPPPDNRPVALSEPHEFAVEIYRGLRTNIQFLGLDKALRIIQVTSSLPGEGKTTTASNLAVVLAQAGGQVVLVDADLRRPRLHEVFTTPATPGLTELLLGERLEMAVNHLEGGLHVVTAGMVPPNPSEMLSSSRVGALLADLASRYDYVIVDSAPVLPVADAIALSGSVHGVLLVAQAHRTSKHDVTEALARLERVGAPVFGLVLNRARAGSRDGGYGYGYGYGYGPRRTDRPTGRRPASMPPPPAGGPAVAAEPR